MNRKTSMDLLLSKVAEGQKDAFVAELRETKTKKERAEVLAKYGVALTDEERETIKKSTGNEISDEELGLANGGCNCAYVHCECTGCV